MKIDGKHYCDWCCDEFDERDGRLHTGVEKDKDGFGSRQKWAIRALFGVLLCEDCHRSIEPKKLPAEKKTDAQKKLMRYIRKVESSRIVPPWIHARITKDGETLSVPQKGKL